MAEVELAVADGIATITLNRPDRLNAFTETMRDELVAAFDQTDGDDDVRAVIVTGAGRAFCAGADLAAGGETFSREQEQRDGGGVVALRIFESLKPVIAAINGPAVGVGITMTLPMDVRLVVKGAKVGFVFARRGIVPEAASSWFLPRIVGISQALEWAYSGRILSADEVVAGGLARGPYTPDELLPAAHALAREIADHAAPVSVALSRQLMWRGLTFAHPMESHEADTRAIRSRGRSADAVEGVTAFLEKRPAAFPERVSSDLPDVF